MNIQPQPNRERLEELLADRALFGLSTEEQFELESLLEASPEIDPESFDRTAALVALTSEPAAVAPIPEHLRARIVAAATKNRVRLAEANPPDRIPAARWLNSVGWLVAAACLLIAIYGWSTMSRLVEAPRSLAEQRATLLEQAPDLVKLNWTATQDPAAVNASGDLVWSNAKQEGFMRFRGLAPNDPARSQYQLWIFDGQQDERYPIDGGVFDVEPSSGDVLVPIRAALRVVDPKLFAVTVEKPGGVVVSSRERLPLLAEVPKPQG